jgi:hypothetical protein
LGGDEFYILQAPSPNKQGVDTVDLGRIANHAGIYAVEGQPSWQPLQVVEKEGLDKFAAQVKHAAEVAPGTLTYTDRVERLASQNQEIALLRDWLLYSLGENNGEDVLRTLEIYQQISGYTWEMDADIRTLFKVQDDQDRLRLMQLFVGSFADPVTRTAVEQLRQETDQLHQEQDIFVYAHQSDLLRWMQQPQDDVTEDHPDSYSYHFIKMELPGSLKWLNDHPDYGYRAGNALISHTFAQFVRALRRTYSDRPMRFTRNGGDISAAILLKEDEQIRDVDNVEQQVGHIIPLSQEGEANTEEFPIVPIVSSTKLVFHERSGMTEQALTPENSSAFSKAQGELQQQRASQLRLRLSQRYIRATTTPLAWEILADYINPFGKRGPQRLAELQIDPLNQQLLKQFYIQQNDQSVEFDKSKVNEFRMYAQYSFLSTTPRQTVNHLS